MKNLFYIAYYTIKRNFRDIKSMLNMLLLPIVLVLILGNALGGVMDIKDLDKRTIILVNQDNGEVSKGLEDVLKSKDVKEFLNIKNYDNATKAEDEVKKGKAVAYVEIAKDFTGKVMKGEKAQIKIYALDKASLSVSIIQTIVDTYLNYVNMNQAIYMSGLTPAPLDNSSFITQLPLSAKSTIPSAMNYYAVTMLVMVALYGSQYAIHGISEDYLETMRSRLRSTPVSQFSHYAGKILGMVATVFTQLIVLILFTKFAYNVNWGNNYFMILVIALTMTALSVTLGVAITMLIKKKEAASAIVSVIIPVMTFFSGGYAKFNIDTGIFHYVRKMVPSSLGHTAFFDVIYGETMSRTFYSLAVLWGFIIVLGAIAIVSGRRRLN